MIALLILLGCATVDEDCAEGFHKGWVEAGCDADDPQAQESADAVCEDAPDDQDLYQYGLSLGRTSCEGWIGEGKGC